MSWLNVLYETYENVCAALADGAVETSPDAALSPIGHTTQLAQIEVIVNEWSEFVDARVPEKEERETLIPCTEASASRGGIWPPPHPLFDKLQYVAGDYVRLGGKKSGKFHEDYMDALRKWASSPYSTDKLRALAAYLEKGTLMQDLVNCGVLRLGEDGRVPDAWEGPDAERPAIYKAVPGSANDAFVRFCVSGLGAPAALWQDTRLQEQYVAYITSQQGDPELCYVTGELLPAATSHPYKIRNSGDKAKLISANDISGYTYRGRFTRPEQAAQVGFEVTQKAHNALKYLIEKQGRRFGTRVYVTWNPRGRDLPDPMKGADELDEMLAVNTGQSIAERVNAMLAGYENDLTYNDTAVIMGVDAATTGRLSIVYYRESLANELIENLRKWQTDCAWLHGYRFVAKEDAEKYGGQPRLNFYGAPSPRDIALAAYGKEQSGLLKIDDKLLSETVGRILPCIADRARFPRDIAEAVFRNVCRPLCYSRSHWLKILSICCSLTKKICLEHTNSEEVWDMAVKRDYPELSYQYGRWLAVADAIERRTFEEGETGRETTAIRYFSRFASHPQQTLDFIRARLNPYLTKLGKGRPDLRRNYEKLLSEIASQIGELLLTDLPKGDTRPSSLLALGFDSQRQEIYAKRETDKPDAEQTQIKEGE